MIASNTIAGRLCAHPGLKLALACTLPLVLCVPYFALQNVRSIDPFEMPATLLDQAIPYGERWIWVYVSLYLFLLAPPLLSRSGQALRRYAMGFIVVCLASHAIFLIWPTTIALPGVTPLDPGLAFVLSIDGQSNAFPSLHASLAVFTALCVSDLFGDSRYARSQQAAALVWAAAIAWSTLPTRRHVVIDLVAGTAVAVFAFWLTGRRSTENQFGMALEPAIVPQARTTVSARLMVSKGRHREIAALRVLDARHRIAEIGLFVGMWIAGASLTLGGIALGETLTGWIARVVGTCVSAVAINAFVLLLHEGMHGTLFAGRSSNRWCSVAFGALALMSFSAYKVMHARHHDYLGEGRDPDDYNNYTDRAWLVWTLHYVRLVVGTVLYIFLIPAFALRYARNHERRAILFEYAILVLCIAVVFALVPGSIVINAWAIPVVLVAYFTSIRGFTQHGITVAADPFLASRSIESPRIVAFCLLNENYHLEHHLFPEIPSYNLKRLRDLIDDRIPYRVTGTSYLAFILAFLRATPERDERPIGLAGASER